MVQAVDVLLDKVRSVGKVVVVGASLTGVEVADYVSVTSQEVVVIEALKKFPISMGDWHGRFLYQKLRKAGIKVVLNAPLAKIEKGGVFYSLDENMEEIKDVNLVILAVGSRSERSLLQFLTAGGIPNEIIGDAAKPRTLHDAIHEGFKVSQLI
jgi:pyruvate/2-oxoglutarate dehydrogenase complex dihydrolipoamide dehydrogenase (E3) component